VSDQIKRFVVKAGNAKTDTSNYVTLFSNDDREESYQPTSYSTLFQEDIVNNFFAGESIGRAHKISFLNQYNKYVQSHGEKIVKILMSSRGL